MLSGREDIRAKRDLANLEVREIFKLLLDGLHASDRGSARTLAAEAHERFDDLGLPFEDCLHRSVRSVAHPTRGASCLRCPRNRQPEADALNTPMHDDPAPDRHHSNGTGKGPHPSAATVTSTP